tara:strand:- start:495 stop:680 length:186 start_codon:yes stop_codon:yes gene_type:complete
MGNKRPKNAVGQNKDGLIYGAVYDNSNSNKKIKFITNKILFKKDIFFIYFLLALKSISFSF